MSAVSVMADSRPKVSQLLSPGTIVISLRSDERDGVFSELIDRIPDLAHTAQGKQALLRALQEREKLGSTGLGHGVALPHARNAIPGFAAHATIVFGRHAKGIAYGASDGAPVTLFFLLVVPTISQHLQILARLSRLLRRASLRQNLLAAQDAEQVIAFIREAEANV